MGSGTLFILSILGCMISVVFTTIGFWHPQSTEAGLLFGISLGIGIFSGSFWLYKVIFPSPVHISSFSQDRSFDPTRPQELVDYIDEISNSCLIATNNGWLKNNWHSMNDTEKTNWVLERFPILVDTLKGAKTVPEIITAIQMADKNYTRGKGKSA